MTGPEDVDVAIVGGGPGGAAAALTLLRYTPLRVALIERSRFEDQRPGEALPPGVGELLAYLDVSRVLDTATHLPAHGTAASWGSSDMVSRDFLFTGRGGGWHLDRRQFDSALTALVAERGGVVMLGATIARDSRAAGRWRLEVRHATDPARPITARFMIDASGSRAVFARRRGARRAIDDRLFGLVGHLSFSRDGPRDTLTMVESCPAGWWVPARLPNGRMVAALMTDADIIRQHRLRTPAAWRSQLDLTAHTRRRMTGAAMDGCPVVYPAFSQILDPVNGVGWIATGDAAVCFDPLSSMGIGYAITSGIHAARAAADALAGDHARLGAYAGSVRAHYDAYWARRCEYCAMERRWPDAPFWAKRKSGA